jgi:hypothetical protein
MKKRLSAILLVSALAFASTLAIVLAGCGEGTETPGYRPGDSGSMAGIGSGTGADPDATGAETGDVAGPETSGGGQESPATTTVGTPDATPPDASDSGQGADGTTPPETPQPSVTPPTNMPPEPTTTRSTPPPMPPPLETPPVTTPEPPVITTFETPPPTVTPTVPSVTTSTVPPPVTTEGDTGEVHPGRPAKHIAHIYVSHGAMQFTIGEYKIDFVKKECWMYSGDYFDRGTNEIVRRDPTAANEGYTFVRKLRDADIEAFYKQCDKLGFTSWDDEYVDHMIADGHRWRVVITYADGSTKTVFGSNDYPDTYGNMREAFRALTGEAVLID